MVRTLLLRLRIGSSLGVMRRFAPSMAGLIALLAAGGAAQAVDYRKLLDFGANGVPQYPYGGVVVRNATIFGGTVSTVYSVSATGDYKTFKTLHTFPVESGTGSAEGPVGDLVMDPSGFLYGVADFGGAYGYGEVFKVGPVGGGYEVLHNFTGGLDGKEPHAPLALDMDGNIYGGTGSGGPKGEGMVYKLAPDRTDTFLKGFTGPNGDGVGGLIRDAAGNLYGTGGGGPTNCFCGVIFKLAADGTETLLHAFRGPDGYGPCCLIMDAAGNLYGATSAGGPTYQGTQSIGDGTVFKISPDKTFQILYSFTGGSDGYDPRSLVMDAAGNLYGTAQHLRISCACGLVFKLTPGGQYFVMHIFTGNPDGDSPVGGLFLTPEGTLYGATVGGGSANSGTLYAIAGVGKPPPSQASAGR